MTLSDSVQLALVVTSSFVIGGAVLIPIKMMIEKKMSEWLFPQFEWETHEDVDDDFGEYDHDHDEDGSCQS